MKINILLISPDKIIGGMNMKFDIIYKYLPVDKVNKFYLSIGEEDNIKENIISQKGLLKFVYDNKINYIYTSKRLETDITDKLKDRGVIFLKNIVFSKNYTEDDQIINCIISKTLYTKIKYKHKNLKDSFVAYNPCDMNLRDDLNNDKKIKQFIFGNKDSKFTIGRMARAEPSKWDFIIIDTLLKLDKQKNYNYNFLFVGMPSLHQRFLKFFLSKKALDNIIFSSEIFDDKARARFYKTIDLFWQVSTHGESFGNVIAESFSFKKPVITKSLNFMKKGKIIGSIDNAQTELVDDGINGKVLQDSNSVISFLNNSTKDEIIKMGNNGYKKVIELYDGKVVCDNLANILINFKNGDKKLSISPSDNELEKFYKNYFVKIKKYKNRNDINYEIKNKLWLILERLYLIFRKILRKFNYEIEINKYKY